MNKQQKWARLLKIWLRKIEPKDNILADKDGFSDEQFLQKKKSKWN